MSLFRVDIATEKPRKAWILFFRYSLAIVVVVLATVLRLYVDPYFGPELSPFIFYYPALVAAAWYGGMGPGILSVFLSLVLAVYFFIQPHGMLGIAIKEDWFDLSLFGFVGLVISFLSGNLHRTLAKSGKTYRELLKSQNKISNILESVQGCFFSLDEEGRFTHINEDSRDFLSGPREKLYGNSLWEGFPDWRGTEFETQWKQVQERKAAVEFEFNDAVKSKWYDVHIAPSNDGVSVHLYDITSRKEVENALSESEDRFRAVADQAPVMVWMSGVDALCHYFNEPWLKFRGRTLEEEQGHGWTEGIHPDDRSPFMNAYLRAFHGRESFRIEYRLRRFDGPYRWVLDTGIPRFTSGRKFIGFIGSAIDITGRKEAERRQVLEHRITQTLAEEGSLETISVRILQVVCEELNWRAGAYWEIAAEANQLKCRRAWTRTGLEENEFLRENMHMTVSPGIGLAGRVWALGKAFWIDDVEQDTNFPRSTQASASGFRSAVGFPIRVGGEILGVMEFFSSESSDPDEHLLQMFESIGSEIGQYMERKKTEEDLKIAYEEMEKRVQRRTTQLANINETLKEEILERKKVEKEVLEISEKEQRRLGTQIHDDLCQSLVGLMMLTKVLAQKMERKEITEAAELRKIASMLDQSITKAREMARGFYPVELQGDSLMIALQDLATRAATLYGVECLFSCPEPVLIEDNDLATHLYRIAQEAVHNAVKHGRAKRIEIRLARESSMMLLSVQDDGVGIAEPQAASGIGLHIMKYRARLINGMLEIRNQTPKGTLLTCSFSHPTPDSVVHLAVKNS